MASWQELLLTVTKAQPEFPNQFSLNIYSSLGTIIQTRLIEFEPALASLGPNFVVCAGKNGSFVYAWQHRTTDGGSRNLEGTVSLTME
jgi:hypothetical protein